MNVLFLDQFSELGGAQRCLLDLLPAIVSQGWSAHVAAPGTGGLHERAMALGATADPIHCGPYSSGSKNLADMTRFAMETPRLTREIRALIRRYYVDLVYVNGPRLLPAAALAVGGGPRLLFHSHSYVDGAAQQLAGWSLAEARAAIVASCRFVARPWAEYPGHRGVRVIYNGVAANGSTRRSAPACRIGVIGRISPEKGQAEFLRAARILHGSASQCQFVICGGPLFSNPAARRYCAEVEGLAKELLVEFTGWREDVRGVFATLDLLVVPSAPIDATPRVILEAFAAGVPVVAFAAGGIPEIVEDNVTGFLVHERSPEALASTIRRVLFDEPHRLAEVAACALAKARGEFSLERYRWQMLEAIQAARCGLEPRAATSHKPQPL
jgi:glycosyltransferase involved in cell wall biosynthesis